MHAAIVQGPGQIPVYGTFDDPTPQDGERLVTVAASPLTNLTKGRAAGTHYSADNAYPFVPGIDGVGRLADGSRVYFLMPRAPFGAMAERTVVRAVSCLPVPDDLDDVTAAGLANPGMSSWVALAARANIVPGETVLINGATGSAGRLAVQIARHLGASRVIATGRNANALDQVAALGADVTIPLGDDPDALHEAFEAEFATGVDIVLDYLWGPSAEVMLAAAAKATPLARRVRFVQIGSSAGQDIPLSADILRSSAIELLGSGLGSVSPQAFMGAITALFQAATPAGFQIALDARPLSEVASAWNATSSQERIVFTID